MSNLRYSPKERRIFRWHDGQRKRASDPLAVERGFVRELGPNWLGLYKVIKVYNDSAEKIGGKEEAAKLVGELQEKAFDAIERLTSTARKVFGITPATMDDADEMHGMTEPELLELIAAFCLYMNDMEDRARPLPISPSATEHPAICDTASSSDSGSTVAA